MKEMREWVLPVLEAGGADLVLSGHSHVYERSFLLNGHYGDSSTIDSTHFKDKGNGRIEGTGAYRKPGNHPSPNQGTVYTVAGASGKRGSRKLNHPAMYLSLSRLGSVVIDINDRRMDVHYLDDKAKRKDYFTMLKE